MDSFSWATKITPHKELEFPKWCQFILSITQSFEWTSSFREMRQKNTFLELVSFVINTEANFARNFSGEVDFRCDLLRFWFHCIKILCFVLAIIGLHSKLLDFNEYIISAFSFQCSNVLKHYLFVLWKDIFASTEIVCVFMHMYKSHRFTHFILTLLCPSDEMHVVYWE